MPGPIPAGARVVTVTPVSGYGSGPSRGEPGGAFTITDPATVAKIASAVGRRSLGHRGEPEGDLMAPIPLALPPAPDAPLRFGLPVRLDG
ncbi:MAG: hypothetical protein ACRDPY_36620, partial [Streptosporangiaceae bacterium]